MEVSLSPAMTKKVSGGSSENSLRRSWDCRLAGLAVTSAMTPQDKILIVDFGAQYTQLIARRVREAGVYSEIVPFDKAEAALKPVLPKAIILSGGPASVHETGTPQAPQGVLDAGVPIL